MRFEARELPEFIEHVPVEELQEREIYFIVSYLDGPQLLVPELTPVIFVGRDLEPGARQQLYFQDVLSYTSGTRFDTRERGQPAVFQCFFEYESSGVCSFETALDELLRRSLRRRDDEAWRTIK